MLAAEDKPVVVEGNQTVEHTLHRTQDQALRLQEGANCPLAEEVDRRAEEGESSLQVVEEEE